MTVDVLYQGFKLVSGANLTEDEGEAFVALAMPMPVGTLLTLVGPEGTRPAQVQRSREGEAPGMFLRLLEASASTAPGASIGTAGASAEPSPTTAATAEPAAPVQVIEELRTERTPDQPEASPPEASPPEASPPEASPPEGGPPEAGPPKASPPGSGRERRKRKGKKTVIGR